MSPKPSNQPLVYDENLLAQAPEVTQGQRQEGYDADILNPTPPLPSRTPGPSQPYRDHPDVESGSSAHDKHLAAGGYDHFGQPEKKPFLKTPKGIIILVVLALAVIAAVVGGAVGGTVGKNKDNSGGDLVNAQPGNGTSLGPSSTLHSSSLPSSTNAAQPPVETGDGGSGGGGGVGGGGSTATSAGNGATPTTSARQAASSTVASMSSPNIDPPSQPGQPGAGDGL
ncbi:unnamed protein product [Rhizoctonia solani]|uniref:Uncharacterized protein n=1 Tax=Rhizoctonia solani TaxID=456999 RepID=A0A8H2WYI3_9AGAM|nr:unnamed protein product [Rhizoctonia solani]